MKRIFFIITLILLSFSVIGQQSKKYRFKVSTFRTEFYVRAFVTICDVSSGRQEIVLEDEAIIPPDKLESHGTDVRFINDFYIRGDGDYKVMVGYCYCDKNGKPTSDLIVVPEVFDIEIGIVHLDMFVGVVYTDGVFRTINGFDNFYIISKSLIKNVDD